MSEASNQGTANVRPAKKQFGYLRALWATVRTLVLIALAALVMSHYLFPVLKLYTDGMSPAIGTGDMVVAMKGETWQRGDIVAFQFGSKVLVKRVIAVAGDVLYIDPDGRVTLNGTPLDEPYAALSMGECDVEMPYTVPAGRIFVMGDKRDVSLDSRSSAVGAVALEQVIGRVVLRIWPLNKIGPVN